MTKYSSKYAADYACLWAYGKETFGLSGAEPMYSRVIDLSRNILKASFNSTEPIVADIGCGVGRCIRDLALSRPGGLFLGVDNSQVMLDTARQILCGDQEIQFSPKDRGFSSCSLSGSRLQNVQFFRPREFNSYLVEDGKRVDLCLSLNAVERASDVDEYLDLTFGCLSSTGHIIFASSLNWQSDSNWKRFPNFSTLVTYLVGQYDVRQVDRVEEIVYYEQTDVRGSGERFLVEVIVMQKVEKSC